MTYALILAAGKGTRMKTEIPKCAYPILKKPMISYIVEKLEQTNNVDEIICVVGYKKEVFYDLLQQKVTFAVQEQQLGTANAVLSAKDVLKNKKGSTIIVPGDVPLMSVKLTDKIINTHNAAGNDLTAVTMIVDNPKGYGRILRDDEGNVERIVEDKDATYAEKQIREVNTGVYVVNNEYLFEVLKEVKSENQKKEYYLTDIINLMYGKYKVGSFVVRDVQQVMGVNDLYQISLAEKFLREEINKNHMINGVYMVNPETITIGYDVSIEPGVTILPNTTITGKSVIKTGTVVGPNTEIHESEIHENVTVKHSLIYDSTIMEKSTVGPFAHLRENAIIGIANRIGNFVEVKNSQTGHDTKAAHLSYIGDSSVGSRVNFGCGSITVNYDGISKHKTNIGDDVFIGCNVNMIAPLNISNNVFIAAGSTVTKDIPEGSLAIARGKQVNKVDYYTHLIKPKPEKGE